MSNNIDTKKKISWAAYVGARLLAALLVLSLQFFQGVDLSAQANLSTIRGTVFDQSGAAVPGADIRVTDLETNISRSTLADDQGNFEIPGLKPGTYRLEVQLPGFKTFVADSLILESSQIRRVDARLEVGEATTEVTVNALAAVIEMEEAKLSAAFNSQTYEDAPMLGNDRFNPTMLLGTLPGVQMDQSGFNMNVGGMSGFNSIEEGMDGAATPGYVNQIHNMEDVEEVKMVTHNNTADQPRAGYFNLVTKRGTNAFHGNVYYYHQNSALNAREYFAPEKNPTKFHIFGGSASGPILKDKTFFYGSYNAQRDPSTNFFLTSVPTSKMRTGDFSELLGLADPIVIQDPLTGTPFPNNVIPENQINPLALRAQEQYLPGPNRGDPGELTRNFQYVHPYPLDLFKVDYANVRVDHKLTESNEIFGRFLQRWTPYVLPRSYPGLAWTRERYASHLTLTDTHVFSPQLVNSFSFGWYLNRVDDGGEVDGYLPPKGNEVVSDLGLQGVNPQGLEAMGFPRMNIDGYQAIEVRPGGRVQDEDYLSWANSVTWTVGRHIWKFGGEVRTQHDFRGFVPEGTYGIFNFNGSISGYGYSDFLLGLPFSSQRLDPLTNRVVRSSEVGLYFTDTFKASSRLTIDYGLRWDYFGATRFDDDLQYNWDPGTGNVLVPPGTLGQISHLYPVDTINVVEGPTVGEPERGNFAPRLGAAFRVSDLTVVRGGYGIFNEYHGAFANALTGGPFELSETFFNRIENGEPLFAFPNPFPAQPGQIASQSIAGYPVEVKNGLIHQFNLTLERQVGDIGFSASYVGTRARDLSYNLMLNKPQPSLTPFSQNRRPYPQFINASFLQQDGATNYDGLTLRAVRKSGQFTFDAHWTWASNLHNYLNLENPYDHLHWNRDAMLARHRAVVNGMWIIPVGRGQRYLSDLPGGVNAILGGWRTTWVAFFQTGQYFSPSFSGSDPSNTNTFGGLPDRLSDGNLPTGQRSVDRWFDVEAFAVPQPGQFGNSGVNILEGPGRHVHNVALSKDFSVAERFTVQYQAAITNLFNRPNFARPNANISVPTAGEVQSDVGIFNMEKGNPRRIEMRLRIKW